MDPSLWIVVAVLAALVAVAFGRGGAPLAREGLGNGAALLLRYTPLLIVSFLAAGLAEILVPHEWVRSTLGEESGLRGIVLAAAAGVVTPAGPFVSMPIAAAMLRTGAGIGPVVAFLTGWSLLALHRLVAWEVPILGLRFALIRYGLSLLLPIAAGLLARALAGVLAR